jgi:hypothetical protein
MTSFLDLSHLIKKGKITINLGTSEENLTN